jgi:hypothetical protein
MRSQVVALGLAGWLGALALGPACGSASTGADETAAAPRMATPRAPAADDVELVTSWPPSGGITPRFAWTPMTLARHQLTEGLDRDGTTTTREEVDSTINVTAEPGGGMRISFVSTPTGTDPFGWAISRAYHLVHVVTRPDGQIDRLDGADAFLAALKADPDTASQRAVLDNPNLRAVVENTVEQNYVAWIVTWLDLAWVPEPGRTVRRVRGGVTMTVGSEDLGAEANGRVRLRFRAEGKATDISVHPSFLDNLVPDDRFAEASGYYVIELVTDPRTLVPVRTLVEKELRAGSGATAVRGWSRRADSFAIR